MWCTTIFDRKIKMKHRSNNHRHGSTSETVGKYVDTATKVAGLVQGAVGAVRYIAPYVVRAAAVA